MRRLLIAIGVIALLVVPLTAAAKVTRADKRHAKQECTALRKAAGKSNLAALMHSSKRKAYGLCVSRKSREESRERHASHSEAVEFCRNQVGTPGTPQWRSGDTPPRNEFGQCVAHWQHVHKQQMDQHDQNVINAAKACRREQNDPDFENDHGQAFAQFYGTASSHFANAFGKCVSSKARELDEQNQSS